MTDPNIEPTEDKDNEKPPMDIVIEERASMPYALAPFDRSVDMKIWNRRWKTYWLWLEADLTQDEIGEIVGVDRWTVNKDLKAIREFLRFIPERLENQIQEIYMRMVLTRNEIQADARNAEKPADKAKLWTVVASMDNKILERFTQIKTGGKTTEARISTPDLAKLALEYLGEIYGAEAVQHFLGWIEKRVRFEGALKKDR